MSVQDPTEQLWGGETDQGRRELPRLGRARAGGGRALARPHQGRRGARERRARPARRRRWPSGSPRAGDEVAARRARRPVPDRRLPDRLGHLVEHERQRGDREARRRGRASERPRQHGAVLQRRLPVAPSTSPRSTRRRNRLLPALERLEQALAAKADAFADIVKAGRTHLMDAVPVTLGQEFAGYAAQIRLGRRRVRQRAAAGRADPARRHRHRHRPQHAPRVRRQGARAARRGDRASRSARPRTRSRRRPTATRWSSCRAR